MTHQTSQFVPSPLTSFTFPDNFIPMTVSINNCVSAVFSYFLCLIIYSIDQIAINNLHLLVIELCTHILCCPIVQGLLLWIKYTSLLDSTVT